MVMYLSNLSNSNLGVLFVNCMKAIHVGKRVKVIHLKEVDSYVSNLFNKYGIDFRCYAFNSESEKELKSVVNEFDLYFTESTTEEHSLAEYKSVLNIINESSCPVQLVHTISSLTQIVEIPDLFLLVGPNHKNLNNRNTFFSIDSLIKNIANNNPNEIAIGLYHEQVIPLDEIHYYKSKIGTLQEIREMDTETLLITLEENRGLYHSCLFSIKYNGLEDLDLPVNHNISPEVLSRVVRAVMDQTKKTYLPDGFEIYLQGDPLPYPLINQVAINEFFKLEYSKVVDELTHYQETK